MGKNSDGVAVRGEIDDANTDVSSSSHASDLEWTHAPSHNIRSCKTRRQLCKDQEIYGQQSGLRNSNCSKPIQSLPVDIYIGSQAGTGVINRQGNGLIRIEKSLEKCLGERRAEDVKEGVNEGKMKSEVEIGNRNAAERIDSNRSDNETQNDKTKTGNVVLEKRAQFEQEARDAKIEKADPVKEPEKVEIYNEVDEDKQQADNETRSRSNKGEQEKCFEDNVNNGKGKVKKVSVSESNTRNNDDDRKKTAKCQVLVAATIDQDTTKSNRETDMKSRKDLANERVASIESNSIDKTTKKNRNLNEYQTQLTAKPVARKSNEEIDRQYRKKYALLRFNQQLTDQPEDTKSEKEKSDNEKKDAEKLDEDMEKEENGDNRRSKEMARKTNETIVNGVENSTLVQEIAENDQPQEKLVVNVSVSEHQSPQQHMDNRQMEERNIRLSACDRDETSPKIDPSAPVVMDTVEEAEDRPEESLGFDVGSYHSNVLNNDSSNKSSYHCMSRPVATEGECQFDSIDSLDSLDVLRTITDLDPNVGVYSSLVMPALHNNQTAYNQSPYHKSDDVNIWKNNESHCHDLNSMDIRQLKESDVQLTLQQAMLLIYDHMDKDRNEKIDRGVEDIMEETEKTDDQPESFKNGKPKTGSENEEPNCWSEKGDWKTAEFETGESKTGELKTGSETTELEIGSETADLRTGSETAELEIGSETAELEKVGKCCDAKAETSEEEEEDISELGQEKDLNQDCSADIEDADEKDAFTNNNLLLSLAAADLETSDNADDELQLGLDLDHEDVKHKEGSDGIIGLEVEKIGVNELCAKEDEYSGDFNCDNDIKCEHKHDLICDYKFCCEDGKVELQVTGKAIEMKFKNCGSKVDRYAKEIGEYCDNGVEVKDDFKITSEKEDNEKIQKHSRKRVYNKKRRMPHKENRLWKIELDKALKAMKNEDKVIGENRLLNCGGGIGEKGNTRESIRRDISDEVDDMRPAKHAQWLAHRKHETKNCNCHRRKRSEKSKNHNKEEDMSKQSAIIASSQKHVPEPKLPKYGENVPACSDKRRRGHRMFHGGQWGRQVSSGSSNTGNGGHTSGNSSAGNTGHNSSWRNNNNENKNNNGNHDNNGNKDNTNREGRGDQGWNGGISTEATLQKWAAESGTPSTNFKWFRKKGHAKLSSLEFAEFLGNIAQQCKDRGGQPVYPIVNDDVSLCIYNTLQYIDSQDDDILNCNVCSTISLLFAHFAKCELAATDCTMCVQSFSLICSHLYECRDSGAYQRPNTSTHGGNTSAPRPYCSVQLCMKITSQFGGKDFSAHINIMWFEVKRKLARITGCVSEDRDEDTAPDKEKTSSLVRRPSTNKKPSNLESIKEGVPLSTSPSNSRSLRRKPSNLSSVAERLHSQGGRSSLSDDSTIALLKEGAASLELAQRLPDVPSTEAQAAGAAPPTSEQQATTTTLPYTRAESSSEENEAQPTSVPDDLSSGGSAGSSGQFGGQRHASLQAFGYAGAANAYYPSMKEKPTGIKGIDEVVYGDKLQLVKVVTIWDRMKDQFIMEAKLATHYREEGVILKEYKDQLCIKGLRYNNEFQWVKVSHLGNGMTGKCHLAMDFETEFKFCVKELHISNYEKEEIELWSELEHAFIVKVYGAIRHGEKIYILQEFIEGGCLTEAINNQKKLGMRLSQLTALRYFRQLLKVLIYLQSKNILHEDLKADNILLNTVNGNVSIKVTDFGMAKRVQGSVRKRTPPVGTQTQWSPEKAKADGYGFPAEVWAAACVLVHMLSGLPPWMKRYKNLGALILVIVEQSPPVEDIPRNIYTQIRDLICQGFTVCHGQRPTATKLLDHNAFQLLKEEGHSTFSILEPSLSHSTNEIAGGDNGDLMKILQILDPGKTPAGMFSASLRSGENMVRSPPDINELSSLGTKTPSTRESKSSNKSRKVRPGKMGDASFMERKPSYPEANMDPSKHMMNYLYSNDENEGGFSELEATGLQLYEPEQGNHSDELYTSQANSLTSSGDTSTTQHLLPKFVVIGVTMTFDNLTGSSNETINIMGVNENEEDVNDKKDVFDSKDFEDALRNIQNAIQAQTQDLTQQPDDESDDNDDHFDPNRLAVIPNVVNDSMAIYNPNSRRSSSEIGERTSSKTSSAGTVMSATGGNVIVSESDNDLNVKDTVNDPKVKVNEAENIENKLAGLFTKPDEVLTSFNIDNDDELYKSGSPPSAAIEHFEKIQALHRLSLSKTQPGVNPNAAVDQSFNTAIPITSQFYRVVESPLQTAQSQSSTLGRNVELSQAPSQGLNLMPDEGSMARLTRTGPQLQGEMPTSYNMRGEMPHSYIPGLSRTSPQTQINMPHSYSPATNRTSPQTPTFQPARQVVYSPHVSPNLVDQYNRFIVGQNQPLYIQDPATATGYAGGSNIMYPGTQSQGSRVSAGPRSMVPLNVVTPGQPEYRTGFISPGHAGHTSTTGSYSLSPGQTNYKAGYKSPGYSSGTGSMSLSPGQPNMDTRTTVVEYDRLQGQQAISPGNSNHQQRHSPSTTNLPGSHHQYPNTGAGAQFQNRRLSPNPNQPHNMRLSPNPNQPQYQRVSPTNTSVYADSYANTNTNPVYGRNNPSTQYNPSIHGTFVGGQPQPNSRQPQPNVGRTPPNVGHSVYGPLTSTPVRTTVYPTMPNPNQKQPTTVAKSLFPTTTDPNQNMFGQQLLNQDPNLRLPQTYPQQIYNNANRPVPNTVPQTMPYTAVYNPSGHMTLPANTMPHYNPNLQAGSQQAFNLQNLQTLQPRLQQQHGHNNQRAMTSAGPRSGPSISPRYPVTLPLLAPLPEDGRYNPYTMSPVINPRPPPPTGRGKQFDLQLDINKAQKGPPLTSNTYAQTAPVVSPPRQSPEFHRNISVQPRPPGELFVSPPGRDGNGVTVSGQARLPGNYISPGNNSANSSTSKETMSASASRSQFEEQESLLREFERTAEEDLSQHSDNVRMFLDPDDDDFGTEINLDDDMMNPAESLAAYINNDDKEECLLVTFVYDDRPATMRFSGDNLAKTWCFIIQNELNWIPQKFGVAPYCLKTSNDCAIDLDAVLVQGTLTIHVTPVTDTDSWWVEHGGIIFR